MAQPNAYEVITAQIVEAIEGGVLNFTMPWHHAAGLPVNASTGNAYRGINILRLWVGQAAGSFLSNEWASYKQWQAKGAQVRKGEKGTPIVFFKPLEVSRERDGETVKDTIPLIRLSTVFNADQVDGYDAGAAAPQADLTERLEAAEAFAQATGADIRHGGGRAFYQPGGDYIAMPARELFTGTETSSATEAYYSTLLHELTHWTGHKSRLARLELKNRFGDEGYAFEELVAELGAAFACQSLGITTVPREDHAAYIQSWLKVLKGDSKAVFKAAAEAQKALDFLQGLQSTQAEAA
jgi:antirestriction protein ArdC